MRILPVLIVAAASAAGSAQVVLNQTDTFQDGTVMSWTGGANPVNVSTGGPAGAGDRYLQISSVASNLATYNLSQWSGNFTAAGVNRIEADLRNPGATQLDIRLVLMASTFERWSSNSAAVLPPGSPWTHVTWDLAESNFVHTQGTGTWTALMGAVNRMMFRHEPTPSSGGTPVTGTLGIDNVAGYALLSNVFPDSYTIGFGTYQSGGLADLLTSNNSYLYVWQYPFRSRLDPAVRIEFGAAAPPGSFSNLELTVRRRGGQ